MKQTLELLCLAGAVLSYLYLKNYQNPRAWVRIAVSTPIFGCLALFMGLVAKGRIIDVTFLVFFVSFLTAYGAPMTQAYLMARKDIGEWIRFKERLKHWPYALLTGIALFCLALVYDRFQPPPKKPPIAIETPAIKSATNALDSIDKLKRGQKP